MKTISKIAEEIGVSKSAVHKKLKQEPLKSILQESVSVVGNKVLVDSRGEKLIKSTFIKKSSIEVDKITDSVDEIYEVDNITYKFDNTDDENSNAVDDKIDDMVDKIDDIKTMFIERLQKQIDSLNETNKILLQELSKEREILEREREHSRQQAQSLSELSEKLAELTKNEQILMLQNKNSYLLSEENSPENESRDNKKSLSIWQRIFKQKK